MGMKNGHCDRCGKEAHVFQMSMYNTQECCSDCIKAERLRPDYDEARKADMNAIKSGNFNFKGIGL